ncbi:archaetidylserine decarboxylase [Thiolapillus sp.]
MLDKLMELAPKRWYSDMAGRLSRIHLPSPADRWEVAAFQRLAGIDMDEAELPLEAYPTINALFTRKLKEGARQVDSREYVLVSPVDGRLLSFGHVQDQTLVQAKGIDYTIEDLLLDRMEARTFAGGSYVTLYLSPRDYHRVHFPVSGVVRAYRHIHGDSFPVSPWSVRSVERLYCRNERIVTYIRSPRFGEVAVVMVAAMGVAHMTLSYLPYDVRKMKEYQNVHIYRAKGDELGIFHLGSTVIVLTEKPADFLDIEEGARTLMGQALLAIGQ